MSGGQKVPKRSSGLGRGSRSGRQEYYLISEYDINIKFMSGEPENIHFIRRREAPPGNFRVLDMQNTGFCLKIQNPDGQG